MRLVAQLDDAAGAAADEMAAGLVENVKIVLNGGEMHQAAHGQAGHVHKKSEIARVGDQGRILLAPAGFQLRLEEGK